MKSSRLNYADWRTINQIEKINESTAHNTVFESMALQGLIIFLFLSAPLLKHANIASNFQMTQNLLKIYSDFRADFKDNPDFVIDFYSKHSLFLNNIRTFKDKEDLRLFIELTWQYLNATYRKDRFNDTVDNADKSLELIDSEIKRLNAADLKDIWYNGILFLKGMAIHNLRDYKNATPIFKQLVQTDSKNENFKRWLTYSTHGERLWLINIISIVCGLMMLTGILFRDLIPVLIRFPMSALGVIGIIVVWTYEYYIKRSFRKAKKS
jgi:hypothetical protein